MSYRLSTSTPDPFPDGVDAEKPVDDVVGTSNRSCVVAVEGARTGSSVAVGNKSKALGAVTELFRDEDGTDEVDGAGSVVAKSKSCKC